MRKEIAEVCSIGQNKEKRTIIIRFFQCMMTARLFAIIKRSFHSDEYERKFLYQPNNECLKYTCQIVPIFSCDR